MMRSLLLLLLLAGVATAQTIPSELLTNVIFWYSFESGSVSNTTLLGTNAPMVSINGDSVRPSLRGSGTASRTNTTLTPWTHWEAADSDPRLNTANFTVSAWFKLNGVPSSISSTRVGSYVIGRYHNSQGTQKHFTLSAIQWPTNGTFTLWFTTKRNSYSNADASLVATNQLTYGVWYHAACVASGFVSSLYVNGVLIASSNYVRVVEPPTAAIPITIDRYTNGASAWMLPLYGQVDDAMFFNTPLTAAQVSALYNRRKTGIYGGQ